MSANEFKWKNGITVTKEMDYYRYNVLRIYLTNYSFCQKHGRAFIFRYFPKIDRKSEKLTKDTVVLPNFSVFDSLP